MKPPLLFLCHRIPYPPNKGDKIRSYHLLQYLSDHFSIYLGAFIDDPSDWDYVPVLNEICEETCFVKLNPGTSRIKSLSGFIAGKPLTLPYYFSRKLEQWVQKTAARQSIKKLIVYSSAMAQYTMYSKQPFATRVIDFVDVDSDKWKQYSLTKDWPMNWVYRREAELLLEYERKVVSDFDHGFFVSNSEANMFKSISPEAASKVGYYNNGVDTEYFDPAKTGNNPYHENEKVLVFTGAMDYWPNIDAVVWFSEQVLPELIEFEPQIKFYIVGGKPSEAVLKLAENSNIIVTGRVEDIRPYIKYAAAAVAPMRIARGIQNKVLEAMAMERTVISSSQGFEGIDAVVGEELYVANEAEEWCKLLKQLLSKENQTATGAAARQRVLQHYSWEGSLAGLEAHL